MNLTKKQFVNFIDSIKKHHEANGKAQDLLSKLLRQSFVIFDYGDTLEGNMLHILEEVMEDSYGWISYFIYELEFGAKYKAGCAKYKNGKNINLSTAEHLFTFLERESKIRKQK